MITPKKEKIGAALAAALKEGDFVEHKPRYRITSGEMIREVRELQGLTQQQLAELTGIAQNAISALENDRVTLGLERAKILAIALKVHPAVLAFPSWNPAAEAKAEAPRARRRVTAQTVNRNARHVAASKMVNPSVYEKRISSPQPTIKYAKKKKAG